MPRLADQSPVCPAVSFMYPSQNNAYLTCSLYTLLSEHTVAPVGNTANNLYSTGSVGRTRVFWLGLIAFFQMKSLPEMAAHLMPLLAVWVA